MATIPDVQMSVHGPYEDLAIEIVKLIGKIVDGQTPEVKDAIWKGYIADMQAWRAFWQTFRLEVGEGRK